MGGRVVVVGSLNMDLVVRSPRLPRPGETVPGGGFGTFPGGKGANQAVAAARLGAPVAMVGRVGADPFGESLVAGLRADGVETAFVLADPAAPTGVALITVDAAGQNTIVVVAGANAALAPADVDAAAALFDGAAAVVVQLEVPLATVERAAELARGYGVRLLLNPAPPQPLPPDLLAVVDTLVLNETELAALTGLPAETDLDGALRRLQAGGCRRVVATLGAAGAVVAEGDTRLALPAHPVTAVDATAAGDAFVGALAAGLAAGLDLAAAARRGNAAGALAVTRPGAQPSLPTGADVDRLLGGRHG